MATELSGRLFYFNSGFACNWGLRDLVFSPGTMINEKTKCNVAAGTVSAFTALPAAAGDTSGVLPEFGRTQDVQRLYGIKRGTLYGLIAAGKIQSVSLRHKGQKHGCRLIYLASVRGYLHGLMTEQEQVKAQ